MRHLLTITLFIFGVCLASSPDAARGELIVQSLGSGFRSGVITSPTTGQVDAYEFMVGSNNLVVNAVGAFASSGSELTTPTAFAIWDSGENLLFDTIIPSGATATQMGEFRFVSLGTPITLQAGQSYVVGTRQTQGGTHRSYSGPATISPEITIVRSRRSAGALYATTTIDQLFPSQSLNTGQLFAGANLDFQIAAVPEPSAFAIFAVIGMGNVVRRRRCKK